MRVVLAFAILALGGCSVLAGSGFDDPIACIQDPDSTDNVCEGVFDGSVARCIDGFCQSMQADPESCDAVDNDGDGIVDEDLDVDGDGYTYCPTGPGELDCLDSNPNIHPPGLDDLPDEICDGADNDCDGMFDETMRSGAELCPLDGQNCYPSRGGCDFVDCRDSAVGCPDLFRCDATPPLPADCVLIMEDCTAIPCTGDQRCDPLSLLCTDPLPNGASCTADIVCASEHCYPVAALELASSDLGGATQICSDPCCSDADCPLDQVCWAPGTGGRGCVPRTIIDAGPEGPLTLNNCTNELMCGRPGEICVIATTTAYRDDELVLTACGPRVGSGVSGTPCSGAGDCDTGLCLTVPIIGQICSEPCGEADDCPALFDQCIYGVYNTMSDTDYITVCAGDLFPGRGDREGCSENRDCLEEACVNDACAKTCCADRQCGMDRSCRPLSINGRWEMHCVP